MIPVFAYKWIAIGVAFLGLVVAVWVQTARLDATKKEYAAFVATVKAQGEIAESKAKQIEAENKERKEKSDHENAKSIAALNGTIKRLRDERAGSSILPPAAPGAGSAERACFNRDALERALGEFTEEVARIAEEGDHYRVDLDTAKLWALTSK